MKITNLKDENVIEIQVHSGVQMTIRARHWDKGMTPSQYHAATRVYSSWGKSAVQDKDGNVLEVPLWTPDGEDPENDKRWRAYRAAEIAVMKRMLGSVEAVLRVFTSLPEQYEAHFSRKAGCSCSCSPGLVLKTGKVHGYNGGLSLHYNGMPVDIWLRQTHEHSPHRFEAIDPESENTTYTCLDCSAVKREKDMNYYEQMMIVRPETADESV